MDNQLTIPEAQAIARHHGYGQRVPASLYQLALRTLEASKPVVVYTLMNWYEDEDDNSDVEDATFDEAARERGERLQVAERWDAAYKDGGV